MLALPRSRTREHAVTDPRQFDPKQFRNALGMFATGVTIVTARAAS